ncbi:proton-coupled amino acid transporter-like protein pathetic [Ptiloglossa arizonensis]|uniref:proton-coupled amino acid transporter-like protein pathetic n=1 Tax=Ptiloglossa arizonensis TaxID=3350558 RepID=UPI003FA04564
MADNFTDGKHAEHAIRDENEEEEYDPVAHRPDGPLTSDFAVMMHLLKASIGTGILFLPNAFKRTGYVMSITCSIIIGLLCTHTVVVLVGNSELIGAMRSGVMQAQSHTDVGFRPNGGGLISEWSPMDSKVIEFFSGFKIDARIYILAMFPFVYGLGYVPNLMYLTPFSIIGFLFMFVGICVTLYYLLNDFPDPGRLQAFTHVLPAPMYCTLMLYALHNVTMCMPLENTMKNPLHLPRLITFSMLLNTLMYTVFGFLGYNKYTNRTCDTIIKNLPIEEP